MKKKIVIFSSYGGGGHTAVTKALTAYLNNDYEIRVSNIFTEVLGSLDPIQKISGKKACGEDFYNKLIGHKWYRTLNLYYKLGAWYFTFRGSKVASLIEKFIKSAKPDLIISVVPIINAEILKVAQKLNIPFLLIPTDLDIRTFLEGIQAPTYNKLKIALGFNDDEAWQRIAQAQISPCKALVTGFVIRPDFFEAKNKSTIKVEYAIPEEKPVILLLLGAMGLQSVNSFMHELVKIKIPVHLLVCTGRQESLKAKINDMHLPSHITITTIGYTDRISDLMSVADLLITKSGSVSVCEAIYMNLPMLLDATTPPLMWEQCNHRFIQRHNFGVSIKDYNSIAFTINDFFNTNSLKDFKKNLLAMPKKIGGPKIKQIIEEMLKV